MQKNALKQFNAMKYLRSITASLGCHSSLSHVVTINFNYQTYRTSAAVPNYLRTRDNRSVRIIITIIIHNHNRNQNHSFHYSPGIRSIHIEELFTGYSCMQNKQIIICVNISGSARGPH